MGEGEIKTGGAHRPSILADAMEAIFGAVFREAGFETAQRVILHLYEPILTALTPEKMSKDPKTRLQELLQGEHLPRPEYAIVNTTARPMSVRSNASAASIPSISLQPERQRAAVLPSRQPPRRH